MMLRSLMTEYDGFMTSLTRLEIFAFRPLCTFCRIVLARCKSLNYKGILHVIICPQVVMALSYFPSTLS